MSAEKLKFPKTETIPQMFERLKVFVKNTHMVYASGRHGSFYFNKNRLYPHIPETRKVGDELAFRITLKSCAVEAIAAPAISGAILSQWVAHGLYKCATNWWMNIPVVFTEREHGLFTLKRGFGEFIRGKKVLVIEDVLNTGGSAIQTITAIEKAGGIVETAACIWSYGKVTAENLGVKTLITLMEEKKQTWNPEECPLCKEKIPINAEMGHGAASA
jgi:orotate phosphoribosyltransferase